METLENGLEQGASERSKHEEHGAVPIVGHARVGRDDVDVGESKSVGDPPRRGAEVGSDLDASTADPGQKIHQENDATQSRAEIIEDVGLGQTHMVDQVENDPGGNRFVMNHLAVGQLNRIGPALGAEDAVEQEVEPVEPVMRDAGSVGSVTREAIELAAQVGRAPETGEHVGARAGNQRIIDGGKVVA